MVEALVMLMKPQISIWNTKIFQLDRTFRIRIVKKVSGFQQNIHLADGNVGWTFLDQSSVLEPL